MTEGSQVQPDGGRFETIDPKLTVFALANGMDLDKAEGFRRLSWFTEGLERGLRIEAASVGAFVVTAMAWQFNSPSEATESSVGDEVAAEDLTGALEAANGLRL